MNEVIADQVKSLSLRMRSFPIEPSSSQMMPRPIRRRWQSWKGLKVAELAAAWTDVTAGQAIVVTNEVITD